MPEELISYISHRLKILSITIIIVSATGLAFFSHPDFSRLKFFGTSVGAFECAVFLVFFAVLWVVLEIDNGMQKEKEKHEKFCKFADKINEYRFSLKTCPEGIEGFRRLQETLLEFSATIFGKFNIVCPQIPRNFNASEWETCKEEWRIFLDNLYFWSKRESLKLAREFTKAPFDILPKDPS